MIPSLRDRPEPPKEGQEAKPYRVPWPLVGAPGYCWNIDGEWWHAPGSCEFCAGVTFPDAPMTPEPR